MIELTQAGKDLLLEIALTPLDQLINEAKAHWQFEDMQEEIWLEGIIPLYEKWADKSLHKPTRKLYLAIIKGLKKELADVRKTNSNRRRTMGRRIGRDRAENGNARDTNKLSPKTISQPVRIKKEGIYRIGRSPK